jgi:hypothetical protein
VEELVSLAIKRLCAEDDPSLETLRMQVAFDSMYVQKQEALEKERAAAKRAYSLVEQSICALKLQSSKDVGGMSQLQRLFVAALLTKTGQSVQNEVYQKEVGAGLESVLPRANLHAFTSLDYADKRDRLEDLHHYVLGIRLFNKAIGKGGTGLADKVTQATQGVTELEEAVREQHTQAAGEVDMYSRVISFAVDNPEDALASTVPVRRLQDELTNRRQLLAFLESFQNEVGKSVEQVNGLAYEYDAEMEELTELVGRKNAVPKEKVYPLFEGLARKWIEADEIVTHVSALATIFDELRSFVQPGYDQQLTSDMYEAARRTAAAAEEQRRPEASAGAEAGAAEAGTEVPGEGKVVQGEELVAALQPDSEQPVHVFRSQNPEIGSIQVHLNGYCPVTITSREGMLLPGDPSSGNVLFKGRLYSFVSMEALLEFLKEPQRFLDGVLLAARKAPELINLLDLEHFFPHNILRTLVSGLGAHDESGVPQQVDADCQTPTHIVEKYIDPKYDWNEWSLRRKALQLANLHNKRTHSTQTAQSHFRRESETQVYLPKAGAVQTATTRGTRPVKQINYIRGLRGHPDQDMSVVKVEIDTQ